MFGLINGQAINGTEVPPTVYGPVTLFAVGLPNTGSAASYDACTALALPSLLQYSDANALGSEDLPGQRTVNNNSPAGVAFSPNGKWMAITTGNDSTIPAVRPLTVFDLEAGTRTVLGGTINGSIYPGTFSADSSRYAYGDDTSPFIKIYDTSTWAAASAPSATASSIWTAYNQSGTLLASLTWTGNRLRVFNTADWSAVTIPVNITTTCYQCKFSPDGTKLYVTHASAPYISVFDTTTWAKTSFVGGSPPTNTAYCIAFSADGAKMAIGAGSSPYVYFYEGLTRKYPDLGVLAINPVKDVAFSADGQYVAAVTDSNSGSLTVWNATTAPTYTRVGLPAAVANAYYRRSVAFAPAYLNNALSTTPEYPVTDEAGLPAVRKLRAYSRETGKLLGSTTSAANGAYSIGPLLSKTPATIVFLDDAAGTVLNDLAVRAVPG